MMKYLVLIAVVLLALWWIGRPRRRSGDDRAAAPGATRDAGHEPMLRCRHCGVHLPASEAVKDAGGEIYCSAEHRLAHERRDDHR